jgi:hypothetical protein
MTLINKVRSFFGLVRQGDGRQAVLAAYVEVLRRMYGFLPNDGVDIVEEEWDTLILLDACRYEYYEELTELEGDLKKRTSRASSTAEWLTTNFTREHDDIVYVSANPRISNEKVDGFRGTDHFREVINVWRTDWNPDLNTVEPKPVTDAALKTRERYPDKRIIVHYIQPHAPWIGDTKLSDRDTTLDNPTPDSWIETGKTWGTMLKEGMDTKTVKQAYEDNLEIVLDEVQRLVSNLDGRVVVTSDHGECFGEKFIIEHPSGIYVDELVDVPWHVVDTGGDE